MICDHCDNPQEDCDKRKKLWQSGNLLVICLTHINRYDYDLIELTEPIICGVDGCSEDGAYLVKYGRKTIYKNCSGGYKS